MNCAYHPTVESQEFCSTCSKALCVECAHRIRSKIYCEECLVRGAEWAATVKNLKLPTDAPKRAAALSLIPGLGAVYNGDYFKAITQFSVFAALVIMSEEVSGVFGFGAFVYLISTLFDSYRQAEANIRARLTSEAPAGRPAKDRSPAAWGIFLIGLGVLFLLKNVIPYYFINRLWPLAFIALGGYIVYRSLQDKKEETAAGNISVFGEPKE